MDRKSKSSGEPKMYQYFPTCRKTETYSNPAG